MVTIEYNTQIEIGSHHGRRLVPNLPSACCYDDRECPAPDYGTGGFKTWLLSHLGLVFIILLTHSGSV